MALPERQHEGDVVVVTLDVGGVECGRAGTRVDLGGEGADAEAGATLLLLHAKLGRWFQPGGHADGDTNLAAVALRASELPDGTTVSQEGYTQAQGTQALYRRIFATQGLTLGATSIFGLECEVALFADAKTSRDALARIRDALRTDEGASSYFAQLLATVAACGGGHATIDRSKPSLWDLIAEDPHLSRFRAALERFDLDTTLDAPGDLTVFAPTDDAFARLPAGTLERLEATANEAMFDRIVIYHLVDRRVGVADLRPGVLVTSLEGDPGATVTVDGGVPAVNGVPIGAGEQSAANGILHVIDAVLIPPSVQLDALAGS